MRRRRSRSITRLPPLNLGGSITTRTTHEILCADCRIPLVRVQIELRLVAFGPDVDQIEKPPWEWVQICSECGQIYRGGWAPVVRDD